MTFSLSLHCQCFVTELNQGSRLRRQRTALSGFLITSSITSWIFCATTFKKDKKQRLVHRCYNIRDNRNQLIFSSVEWHSLFLMIKKSKFLANCCIVRVIKHFWTYFMVIWISGGTVTPHWLFSYTACPAVIHWKHAILPIWTFLYTKYLFTGLHFHYIYTIWSPPHYYSMGLTITH